MADDSRGKRPAVRLDQILRELKDARGLGRRATVLMRHWREVQALEPREREQVIATLGSDAVWRRLERRFERDGELSEAELAVKEALDRAASDPSRVRDLWRQARERDYRGAAAGAADVLLGERSTARSEEEEPNVFPEREVETASGPEPEPEPVPQPEPTTFPEPGPELEPEVGAQPEVAGEPPLGFEERQPPPTPSSLEPDLLSEVAPESGLQFAPSADPAEERIDRPVDELRTAAAKLAVLRALRSPGAPDDPATGGKAARARLLATLGSGWAQRRALSELIRARRLGSLEEALTLIRELDRDAHRTWCLADLVEHWHLTAEEQAAILEAAPSAATRRRLAGRLARR